MNIIKNYIIKNECYNTSKKIKVSGLMLHSVGCAQPDPKVFVRVYNKPDYYVGVHGFVGADETYITLPCLEKHGIAHRAWHCGSGSNGSGNNTHIGIEMCEPACITYGGGASFTCSDHASAVKYVERVTRNAVELFAKLCKFHDLHPLGHNVIISHNEGSQLGIASGHVDPEHLWKGLGMDWTMDKFRQAVFEKLNEAEEEDMTLDRFKELMGEYRNELRDNNAETWSQADRQWAIDVGLINGDTPLPDGSPNYMWEDFLTREQAIALLHRMCKILNGN